MKKINYLQGFFIFGLLIYLTVNTVKAQYVTLEGRQFKSSNGQNFYPMVCNYTFMTVYNEGSNDYYLSRINGYGAGDSTSWNPMPNYEFECTDSASAYAEIIADFTKIHNMGFNCIRTSGSTISKTSFDSSGVVNFYLTCFRNRIPLDDSTGGATTKVIINPPYSSNNFILNTIFPGIELILQAARTCSLKVLLDCGYGDIARDSVGIDATDYAGYLNILADRFKNDTTLLAYVVIEEPAYSYQTGVSKQKVCQYTKMWYDTIKAIDPNHLITMGGSGFVDVWDWDPEVMKLDFYSPHIYPSVREYEGYDPNEALKRIKGHIIWINNNSPMPWIIGETGFNAINDYYDWDSINFTPKRWIPFTLLPPLTDGTLTDQATYATNSLAAVRNCGGSGYSWWNYQENWWATDQDGYGLLKHGTLDTINKPVVNVFTSYSSPPPAPQVCDYPDNYHDPNNFYFYNPYSIINASGTITETAGSTPLGTTNPIAEAYIGAWIAYKLTPTGSYDTTKSTYTFSEFSGYYAINPWYPNSIDSYYRFIGITASGAEKKWHGWPFSLNLDDSLTIYSFKRNQLVINETVTASTSRNFQGWDTLTSYYVTVKDGAVSEFKARNSVTINGDFTAEIGSDVTIYCTPTFPECKEYSNLKIMHANNPENDETQSRGDDSDKQIEVKFIPVKEYAFLDIYPNPGNGIFTLNLRTNKVTNSLMRISVYDITGSSVFKGTVNENLTNLDLSFLSKGIYYLHASIGEDAFNQKLIIK